MSAIAAALEAKRRAPEDALPQIAAGSDLIVGLGNGEPKTVVDAVEAGAEQLRDVRLHQMLPLRDRPYASPDRDRPPQVPRRADGIGGRVRLPALKSDRASAVVRPMDVLEQTRQPARSSNISSSG